MHSGLLIMGIRRLVAALPLFIGMVAHIGPAMAEPADTLPEHTLREIAASPEKYLARVLGRMREYNPDGPVTRADVKRWLSARRARERSRVLAGVLAYDLDGDGTVTRQEYETKPDGAAPKNSDRFDKFVSLADSNLDGVFSATELYAYADRAAGRRSGVARTRADAYDLSQFDADGDETVTEAEVRSQVEALAARLDTLYSGPSPEQCRPPAPPPGAQVVLLGGYEGAGLSSVALDGMDSVTFAGTLEIEPGEQPLYIFATSRSRILWKVSGAVERVVQFVAQPPLMPALGPGTGVAGLPSDVVRFVGPEACFKPFHKSQDGYGLRAVNALGKALGIPAREILVIGHYTIHEVTIPSGRVSPTRQAGTFLGIKFTTPKPPRDDGPSKAAPDPSAPQTLPHGQRIDDSAGAGGDAAAPEPDPEIEVLSRELLKINPGGVIVVDPAEVVAPGLVRAYDVLPIQAGAIQLLESGAIRKTSEKTYTVVKPIPRLPAGWIIHTLPHRRFVFAKGIVRPDEGPGRAGSWVFR